MSSIYLVIVLIYIQILNCNFWGNYKKLQNAPKNSIFQLWGNKAEQVLNLMSCLW